MPKVWIYKDIEAGVEIVWTLLTNLERWGDWGPSVRRAEIHGERFELGATGTITTALGPRLKFEITGYEPGSRWTWKVAGIDATDHIVMPLGVDRCRVGFGVSWVAVPYVAILQIALNRVKTLAEKHEVAE